MCASKMAAGPASRHETPCVNLHESSMCCLVLARKTPSRPVLEKLRRRCPSEPLQCPERPLLSRHRYTSSENGPACKPRHHVRFWNRLISREPRRWLEEIPAPPSRPATATDSARHPQFALWGFSHFPLLSFKLALLYPNVFRPIPDVFANEVIS